MSITYMLGSLDSFIMLLRKRAEAIREGIRGGSVRGERVTRMNRPEFIGRAYAIEEVADELFNSDLYAVERATPPIVGPKGSTPWPLNFHAADADHLRQQMPQLMALAGLDLEVYGNPDPEDVLRDHSFAVDAGREWNEGTRPDVADRDDYLKELMDEASKLAKVMRPTSPGVSLPRHVLGVIRLATSMLTDLLGAQQRTAATLADNQ